MNFYNSALIQDDMLANVAMVVDHDYPANPTFLHSLGTLVEAVVLHENVYVNPTNATHDNSGDRETLESQIDSSSFVQQLRSEGVITQFPSSTEINAHLEAIGSDYNYWEFIRDLKWQTTSFNPVEPEGERSMYVVEASLMKHYPNIFSTKELVDDSEEGSLSFKNPAALKLATQGMPVENLIDIETWNHIACGYVDMARNLSLNLYLVDKALPHQAGGIRLGNRRARRIYENIEARLHSLDSEDDEETSDIIGKANFHKVQIPPLCQIVLANCKDSKNALAEELFNVRHRHRKFRQYLTSYDKAWDTARTRKDRMDIRNEYENAWKTLTTAEDRPSTRFIYVLWDVFKNPTRILQSIGDKVADHGREISVIGRARGLHDFWNDMVRSPVAERNRELMTNLFPNQVEEEVWEAANRFGQSANDFLLKSSRE